MSPALPQCAPISLKDMSRFRLGRAAGIALGTLVILAIGLYGPATLLGPSPPVAAHVGTHAVPAIESVPPALPEGGASAVTLDAKRDPLAVAGDTDAVPLASTAKIVTALVILDARPLARGRAGPAIPITLDDYRSYIDNSNADNVAVTVLPGEVWSEREMLEAMVLGSSNNHAQSLARWAFGSRAAFLDAASVWLIEHDLTSTHLADETGLSEHSVGTAADIARLAALAMANPTLAEILTDPTAELFTSRGVKNHNSYLPDLGITGISRSYTDAAGICLLFAATVTVRDTPLTFYGVFLGLPDWDALDAATGALMDSAAAGVTQQDLVVQGEVFATFTSPWGDTANGVANSTKAQLSWPLGPLEPVEVTTTGFSTNPRGAEVGTVSVASDDGMVTLPLTLDEPIMGPGPGWRLLNPIPMISALIDSL